MPLKFHYNAEKKLIYGSAEGLISLEDFKETLYRVTHSTEFPPDTNALWDLREMNFDGIHQSHEQRMILMRKEFPERANAKVAYITATDLGFGLTRMYEMLSDDLPLQIQVFRDYQEGEKWLLSEAGKSKELIAEE